MLKNTKLPSLKQKINLLEELAEELGITSTSYYNDELTNGEASDAFFSIIEDLKTLALLSRDIQPAKLTVAKTPVIDIRRAVLASTLTTQLKKLVVFTGAQLFYTYSQKANRNYVYEIEPRYLQELIEEMRNNKEDGHDIAEVVMLDAFMASNNIHIIIDDL